MNNFEIIITENKSHTDFIAEIWFERTQIAELSNEGRTITLFFLDVDRNEITIPLDIFLETLNEAKTKLKEF